MQFYPKIRPRRLARGCTVTPNTVNNFATVSLYNNSTGADLLLVWSIKGFYASSQCRSLARAGTFGNVSGLVVPMVVGGALPPGVLYFNDETPQFTPDGTSDSLRIGDINLPPGIPYGIIQPGWSLSMQDNGTGATGSLIGFIWQVVHPEDLDGHHCHACDGARAAQP